jgi:hypothetical protein
VATTIAAVARRMAAVAAIAAAATKEASVGLLLTAHEGDSNQREKDRDTKNDNTVHPRILQLLTGTSKRENYPRCQFMRLTSRPEGERARCDLTYPARIRSFFRAAPVKLCGLRRMWRTHRLGRSGSNARSLVKQPKAKCTDWGYLGQ